MNDANLTDHIAWIAGTQDVTFSLRVLLREVDEFEGHGSPPLEVEKNEGIVLLEGR